MNEEQRKEWLAAAKTLLDGEEIEFWNEGCGRWLEKDDLIMHINIRYRPKPKPKMIRVCWDYAEIFADAEYVLDDSVSTWHENTVIVSTDDLLKIDRRGDSE